MTRAPTVGERMAPEPIVIEADASLTTAAQIMDRVSISGLPVVDHSGSLVGVLSQADLARARSTEHIWTNWPGLRVRHLMTAPAVTVTPATPLALAVQKMERLRIHRLVVVGEGDPSHPIGVLSLTDVVHEIVESRRPRAAEPGEPTDATEPTKVEPTEANATATTEAPSDA